jgi:hypothetical protein
MQRGQIVLDSGSWYVRYWADEIENGRVVRRRACKKLARYSDTYRSKKDVRDLAQQYLAPANAGHIRPDSSLTFSEFTEKQFFAHIEDKIAQGYKKPSTLKFYKDVYNNHLTRASGIFGFEISIRFTLKNYSTKSTEKKTSLTNPC